MSTKDKFKVSQNFIDFEFWFWEYQRRNASYAVDVGKLIAEALENYNSVVGNSLPSAILPKSLFDSQYTSCLIPPSVACSDKFNVTLTKHLPDSIFEFPEKSFSTFIYCAHPKSIREFISKHKRFPKQITNGYSGEAIIRKCIIEDKKIVFDVSEFHIPQLVSTFKYDKKTTICTMTFPVKSDPDLIAKEAKYFLAYESENGICEPCLRKSKQYFIDLIEFWVRSKVNKRLIIKNPSRAIGVWLWDKQIQEGLSQAKTIRAFDEQFGESEVTTKCKQFLEEANIRKILMITDNCIRKAQVLPLS